MSPRDLFNRTDKDPGVPSPRGSSALWEEGAQLRRTWGLTPSSWAQACRSGPFAPQATLYSPQVWPSQAPLLPHSHLCHHLMPPVSPYLALAGVGAGRCVCPRAPEQTAGAAPGWDPLWGAGPGPRPAVASPSTRGGAPRSPPWGLSPFAACPGEDLPTWAARRSQPAQLRYQGQRPAAPPRGGATTARPRLSPPEPLLHLPATSGGKSRPHRHRWAPHPAWASGGLVHRPGRARRRAALSPIPLSAGAAASAGEARPGLGRRPPAGLEKLCSSAPTIRTPGAIGGLQGGCNRHLGAAPSL